MAGATGSVVERRPIGAVDLDRLLPGVDEIELWVGLRGGDDEDADLVVIASSNEFGTFDGHVPERSFMRSTVDRHRDKYADRMGAALKAATSPEDLVRRVEEVGLRAVRDVQATIRSSLPPPNAESTIRRKKSSRTLIDNGRLIQSIDFEVVVKEGAK